MLDFNVIQAYDKLAMNLDKAEPDRNVFEFDLTMWSLVKSLASNNPAAAVSVFTLSGDAVKAIGSATLEQLSRLASGIYLSFIPIFDHKELIQKFTEPYDQTSLLNQEIAEFDIAFWSLLNRFANKDLDLAVQAFAVSADIASVVKEASDNQIRYVSSTANTGFEIRCTSELIVQILNSEEDITRLRLKKFQQSLLKGN